MTISIFPVYECDWAVKIFKPVQLAVSRTPCAYVPRTDARSPYAALASRSEALYSTLNAEHVGAASPVPKRTYLLLVVNGLAFELFPVRACTVKGDRARFAIRCDGDFSRPDGFAVFHGGDVVGPIIYHFVG